MNTDISCRLPAEAAPGRESREGGGRPQRRRQAGREQGDRRGGARPGEQGGSRETTEAESGSGVHEEPYLTTPLMLWLASSTAWSAKL